jgi:acetoin:2,6-dichlorophenolindophenol oxidoreductase subunit alpha
MNESVVIQKMGADQPDASTMLEMFKRMLLIRSMESKLKDLFASGEIGGTLHLGIGQEAVQVGVCSNLRKDDYITATHRGHGECLAKGADINEMMAEFFGKKTGMCKGKAGDMHVADFSVGDIAATPIVGSGLPLAVGAALSAKMRGTDQVAAPFFGDGANNQGTFHESLNLASIWKLPVVFVCENNLYAESTRITETTPVKIAERASSYAMPGVQVDGMDVLQVYSAAKSAVQRARSGGGPTLIEALTYRYEGHESGDPAQTYRTDEEVQVWRNRDPIALFRNSLESMGVLSKDQADELEAEAKRKVDVALDLARQASAGDAREAVSDVFASIHY